MKPFYFLVKVLAGNQREPEVIVDTTSENMIQCGKQHVYLNVREISIVQVRTDTSHILDQKLSDKPLSSQLRNRFGFTYNSGHWDRIMNGVKHKTLGFTVLFHAEDRTEGDRIVQEFAERQQVYMEDMNRVDRLCSSLATILKK